MPATSPTPPTGNSTARRSRIASTSGAGSAEIYCYIKKLDAVQPVAISLRAWYPGALMEELGHSCDVMLASPYYMNPDKTQELRGRSFESAPRPVIPVADFK